MSNFKIWHIVLFTYFLITNKIFYNIITNSNKLTLKQKSHVLSFKNAIVLSLFSIFFVFQFFKNNTLHPILSEIVLVYFTSYLVSDLVIGYNDYPNNLHLLEGYIHHSAYVLINIFSLTTLYTPIYTLFLIAEIPTALLSYYNLFDKPKNKKLFSNLFLLFRIIGLIALVFFTLDVPIIKYFALPIICLHIYWYNKSLKHEQLQKKN